MNIHGHVAIERSGARTSKQADVHRKEFQCETMQLGQRYTIEAVPTNFLIYEG